MFSLYDKQIGDYKATGLNSKTKKEAINDGVDYLLSDGGCPNESKVRRYSLKNKELYLNTHDIIVEEHEEEKESYLENL